MYYTTSVRLPEAGSLLRKDGLIWAAYRLQARIIICLRELLKWLLPITAITLRISRIKGASSTRVKVGGYKGG